MLGEGKPQLCDFVLSFFKLEPSSGCAFAAVDMDMDMPVDSGPSWAFWWSRSSCSVLNSN
jgi:hypothetical protein